MDRPFVTYTGHTSDLLDISWSKNFFILTSSMDKTVRLWHISRKAVIPQIFWVFVLSWCRIFVWIRIRIFCFLRYFLKLTIQKQQMLAVLIWLNSKK
jgi:hypothetical protein